MKQKLRRLGTIGLISGFMFVVSACGNDEPADAEEPLSDSEQEAQENVEATQAAYDQTYEIVEPHINENYDDDETVELCEQAHNFEPDFDYDAFIEDIMNEAGVQVEGDSREDPEYRGAFDATDDVILDACEEL